MTSPGWFILSQDFALCCGPCKKFHSETSMSILEEGAKTFPLMEYFVILGETSHQKHRNDCI